MDALRCCCGATMGRRTDEMGLEVRIQRLRGLASRGTGIRGGIRLELMKMDYKSFGDLWGYKGMCRHVTSNCVCPQRYKLYNKYTSIHSMHLPFLMLCIPQHHCWAAVVTTSGDNSNCTTHRHTLGKPLGKLIFLRRNRILSGRGCRILGEGGDAVVHRRKAAFLNRLAVQSPFPTMTT